MNRPADGLRAGPQVSVQFSSPDRRYEPLEPISVRYEVAGIEASGVRAVERSVLWYTEGKGEEDLGIHHFERLTDAAAVQAAAGGTFASRLPASPLSYEGLIVKIRWCVRVRLFLAAGRDFVSEHVFDLGHVPVAGLPQHP